MSEMRSYPPSARTHAGGDQLGHPLDTWDGRPVTPDEFARLVADLLLRGWRLASPDEIAQVHAQALHEAADAFVDDPAHRGETFGREYVEAWLDARADRIGGSTW